MKASKNEEKKLIYATRKYKKRLVSGIVASLIALGTIALPGVLPLRDNISNAEMRISDTTSYQRFEKVGHAYNNYVELKNGDGTTFAAEGADVAVKDNGDGTLTVELTYNRKGIHSDSDNTYFPTSNPWYSFAISNGYDIVSNKVYSLGEKWSKGIGSSELLTDKTAFSVHENGNGTAYWEQVHVGIKDLDSGARAKYYSDINEKGIDKEKIGYFEKLQYNSNGSNGSTGVSKVVFIIKPNKNFVQGKEYVVANYKSYDWAKLFVSNTIVRDKEIKKDYKLLIRPDEKTLTLGKDLTFKFKTSDSKEQTVTLNDQALNDKKKEEDVVFTKILKSADDTAYPFSEYNLTVEGKTLNLDGTAVIDVDGQKYDVFLTKIDTNDDAGNLSYKTLYYNIQKHVDQGNTTGLRYTRIYFKDDTNTGLKPIYKVGDIIDPDKINPTLGMRKLPSETETIQYFLDSSAKRNNTNYKLGFADGTTVYEYGKVITGANRPLKLGDKLVFEAYNRAQDSSNRVANEYVLNIVDTTALDKKINDSNTVKTTDNYNYATPNLKTDYDNKLQAAKDIIEKVNKGDGSVNQKTITDALKALEDAENMLDGDANLKAKQELDAAKAKAIEEINKLPLTPERKEEYKNNINNAKNTNEIDEQVAKAKEEALNSEVSKFKEDNKDILAKEAANVTKDDEAAVDKALADYDKLSDEAKAKLTAEKAKLDEMKKKITDDKAKETAATEAANKFKEDNKDILAKEAANVTKDDEAAVDKALAEYDKLSDEAKAKLTAEKAKLDEMKKKITDDKAKEVELATAKDEAKKAIDKAAEDKKAAIDADNNKTAEEKAADKAKVDEAAKTAKDNVDKATDKAGVDNAKNAGIEKINKVGEKPAPVDELAAAKDEAKKAIDKAATDKKAAIDADTTKSAEEKAKEKAAVDAAAKEAKDNVDKATDKAGVDNAKNAGIEKINKVGEKPAPEPVNPIPTPTENDADKNDPKKPVDKVEVKDPSNLTDEEKDKVKKEVENANGGVIPGKGVVTVGNDGTVTVTYPDGSKDTIPGSEVVKGNNRPGTTETNEGSKPAKPSDKIVVKSGKGNSNIPKTNVGGEGLFALGSLISGVLASVANRFRKKD